MQRVERHNQHHRLNKPKMPYLRTLLLRFAPCSRRQSWRAAQQTTRAGRDRRSAHPAARDRTRLHHRRPRRRWPGHCPVPDPCQQIASTAEQAALSVGSRLDHHCPLAALQEQAAGLSANVLYRKWNATQELRLSGRGAALGLAKRPLVRTMCITEHVDRSTCARAC